MTISQRADQVLGQAKQGVAGQKVYTSHLDRSDTLLNSSPQAVQVSTATVTGATNDKAYILTINGIDVTFTSDASATLQEIANGLADAVNAEPLVRGQVSAVSDNVDTVTLTGLTPGLAFTLTEADAELTTALVTAAASAAAVPFARAVIDQGFAANGIDRLGALAAAVLFTAQVATISVVFGALDEYRVRVRDADSGDLLAEVLVAANTDSATTASDIATALNAALPANSVLAAPSTRS
jgi:hypothetical protein